MIYTIKILKNLLRPIVNDEAKLHAIIDIIKQDREAYHYELKALLQPKQGVTVEATSHADDESPAVILTLAEDIENEVKTELQKKVDELYAPTSPEN